MSIEGYGLLLASLCSLGVAAAQIAYFSRVSSGVELQALRLLSRLIALACLLIAAVLFLMAQGPLESRTVGGLVGIIFLLAAGVTALFRPFRARAVPALTVLGVLVLAAARAL